ncbi:uncharacterized protein PHACADRAFT_264313 [Phanerochaete carnosa HHB-10118-sp]|uniref:Uncharacterized protein n=1 Tax=Phanerochaete carnosa (strain HHB-10118-sp) TaxID=650164 RepID=K5VHT4_PHACS|nr:uncharacterized protein PHACADRAFT_264313 [Phanerochaete carnosa HHB-10118-sp]EKM50793.1 hypothetical protein PHACADRAFT_264313 [Phanerochaete carnosa HHB-10118-sp]
MAGARETAVHVHLYVMAARKNCGGGAQEPWSVRNVELTDSPSSDSVRYLSSRDWGILGALLPALPQLQSFKISCISSHSEEDFETLSAVVLDAVGNHPVVVLHYETPIEELEVVPPVGFYHGWS